MVKKKVFKFIPLMSIFALTACLGISSKSGVSGTSISGSNSSVVISSDTISDSFSLVDGNGNSISGNNGVYSITSGGSYYASGKLEEGQIYVNVSDNIDVELELDGVSISNSSVSPIYVLNCNNFTLTVKKDYSNYIYDNRTTDYSSNTDETIGRSAIYVYNGDLKVNGKGELFVYSDYNSGIHGKDNVIVKNATIVINAMNNGIKGNDKVVIEEEPTISIVAGNNGIVTTNSDAGNSTQHGYIYILGGNLTINSYGDGIDAAYAAIIENGIDDNSVTHTPIIDIYTNKYSTYQTSSAIRPGGLGGHGGGFDDGGTSAEKADDSAKAIKANEAIEISGGETFAYTYDDAIHTNADELDTGNTASANINISGGKLSLKSSDDAIHADGTLTISGGTTYVSESHEGIEGNKIIISGGDTTVFGGDDGVNASNSITISGGRLDVTVKSSGDIDGIDSNGTFTMTDGIVITRGPNSEMAAPLDADGTMSVSGGILIVLGYFSNKISYSGLKKTTSSNGLSSGDHTVTVSSTAVEYNNVNSYSGSTTVIASASATIK